MTPVADRTKTPPSGIAFTGAQRVVPLVVIALALLLFGSFLLWFASRRDREAPTA